MEKVSPVNFLQKITCPKQWKISVKDVTKNKVEDKYFDAVFVCTGFASSPKYPKIEGTKEFKGIIIHSRNYRTADDFKGLLLVHLLKANRNCLKLISQ